MRNSCACHRPAQFDRRRVIAFGLSGLASVLGATSAQTQAVAPVGLKDRLRGGCNLFNPGLEHRLAAGVASAHAEGQSSDRYDGITLSSGDTRLDKSLGIMLADLAGRFAVRPGFAFYNDSDSPNAVALSESRLTDSQGTVLVGRKLLAKALADPDGDMFIMGICAHEFGHIVQDVTGYQDRLTKGQTTVKRLELHADFLSGNYIGGRGKSYTSDQLISLGKSWTDLGDSQFNNPEHHGTSEERLAAIEAGYDLAHQRPELKIIDVCAAGQTYLEA